MASGSNDHAAMQRDGASTPALGSEEDIDANGQAVEILAGLTSLGISQDLREKVRGDKRRSQTGRKGLSDLAAVQYEGDIMGSLTFTRNE